MHAAHREYNPFALLLDPQAVMAELERSDRLKRLASHICRPLDKPTHPAVAGDDAALQDIASGDLDDGGESGA